MQISLSVASQANPIDSLSLISQLLSGCNSNFWGTGRCFFFMGTWAGFGYFVHSQGVAVHALGGYCVGHFFLVPVGSEIRVPLV